MTLEEELYEECRIDALMEDEERCEYCGAIMEKGVEEYPYGDTSIRETVYYCPYCN